MRLCGGLQLLPQLGHVGSQLLLLLRRAASLSLRARGDGGRVRLLLYLQPCVQFEGQGDSATFLANRSLEDVIKASLLHVVQWSKGCSTKKRGCQVYF